MRVVWQLVAVVAVAAIGGQSVSAVRDTWGLTLVLGVLVSVLALLVYRWVVGRTEHRPVTELDPDGAGPALGRGTLIGVVMFGMVITNLATSGNYEVHGLGSVGGMAGLFGFMAAAAVTEEVLYRGVLFRIAEEYLGTWIALVLTALLFGLSHLLNAHATLWGAVAIAIEAGGMLAAAYAATRNLWVPIGVHFGWNFAAGGIFSTEVSGNDTEQGLLDATTSGNEWLTGGDFGPEGSVYSVLFGALLTLAFLWLAHRRGRLVPRRRRADRADATATLPR
ncbi:MULTISPECIES: CPBP family intramembrane glutamic endopeptidase [Streptomyces]|jgi:membrane protease YdiL (CAAX protease family)|uniref:CPBP family intramembrane metalloprotease n=2 Tax=Streptomyces TaxID=1883 RepID=A0A494UVM1_9ACTN|nr:MULTISPECIES: CPBP family intramembrane glutamic endopeptidase [Streptomyces]AYL34481.1 CPBP family intramembrane metalloprotease [Streptomyces fungicidicus]EFL42985.1 abortive infection protein [Streptomyces griseoflavus Tu4000]